MSREKRVPLAGGSADTAGLVKNFRDSVLKMSQEELATKLEVTRVAVLRWESSASEPSAEKYIRLAKLAQERGHFEWAIRFWNRAGVNASVLRELVPEVEKSIGRYERQKSKPQPDKEVRLPLLEDSFFRGDHEGLRSRLNALAIETSGEVEFATFPSAAIPNRNSTFAVRALDDHMRFVFCKGDIVAVDISCGMGSAPFGTPRLKEECDGQIVAAYYRPAQRKSGGLRSGLHLRRLWISGPDAANLKLETDIGKQFEDMRQFVQTHGEPIFPVEGSEEIIITVNPEWSILGRVAAWTGTQWQWNFKQRASVRTP